MRTNAFVAKLFQILFGFYVAARENVEVQDGIMLNVLE